MAVQINIDTDTGEMDVRYSKAIKEHADVVMAWNLTKDAKESGVVWVHHIKARQYEAFDFPLAVELKYCRFGNYQAAPTTQATLGGKTIEQPGSGQASFSPKAKRDFRGGSGGERKQFKKRKQDDLAEEFQAEAKSALRTSISEIVKNKQQRKLTQADDKEFEVDE
jgi:hypothetical protein